MRAEIEKLKKKILGIVQGWVRVLNVWVGLETPEPERPDFVLGTKLVCDEPPSDIIKAWRAEVRHRGLDPNDEFIRMFRFDQPYSYTDCAFLQVKWFQRVYTYPESYHTNTQTHILLPSSDIQRPITISRAIFNEILKFPEELQPAILDGVIAKLYENFKRGAQSESEN